MKQLRNKIEEEKKLARELIGKNKKDWAQLAVQRGNININSISINHCTHYHLLYVYIYLLSTFASLSSLPSQNHARRDQTDIGELIISSKLIEEIGILILYF